MSERPGELEVEGDELVSDEEGFALDTNSVVLALPDSINGEKAVHDILASQSYKPTDYEVIPLSNWRAYEQVFALVIQNLRKKGATGVVINHDTGEVLYRLGDKPTHNFMRLVQLKPVEPAPVLTAWDRLTRDDDD